MSSLVNPYIFSSGGGDPPPEGDVPEGAIAHLSFKDGVYWDGTFKLIGDLLTGYDEDEIIDGSGAIIRNGFDNLNWLEATSTLRAIFKDQIPTGLVVSFEVSQSANERGWLIASSDDAGNLGNDYWAQGTTGTYEGDDYIDLVNEATYVVYTPIATYNDGGVNKFAYLFNGAGADDKRRFAVACNGVATFEDIVSYTPPPAVLQLFFMAVEGHGITVDNAYAISNSTPSLTYVRSITFYPEKTVSELEALTA